MFCLPPGGVFVPATSALILLPKVFGSIEEYAHKGRGDPGAGYIKKKALPSQSGKSLFFYIAIIYSAAFSSAAGAAGVSAAGASATGASVAGSAAAWATGAALFLERRVRVAFLAVFSLSMFSL